MLPPSSVAEAPEKPNEFHRYRQVLAALYITAVVAGFLLLGVSVAKQLFFRSPVVELQGPVLSPDEPDPQQLLRCNDDVMALFTQLGDNVATLLSGPAHDERGQPGARWEAFSREWMRRWDEVDARCRFSELADSDLGVAYDRMARVHGDLPAMRLKYQTLLVRFDDEQAAELARMRRALNLSREVLQERAVHQSGSRQSQ